ncbi:hypothetical protein INR49_024571 [Caranx melampygus]|nr:hypothetical protein INR49_024571 [Caranx melampygus]
MKLESLDLLQSTGYKLLRGTKPSQRLQRDVLLSHQARDSHAAQLDIQEQGHLSHCLNCSRANWISGGTVARSFRGRPAGPGAPESAAVNGHLVQMEAENGALMECKQEWRAQTEKKYPASTCRVIQHG